MPEAIKYKNVCFYSKRANVRSKKIESYFENNGVKYTIYQNMGEECLEAISSHFPGESLSYPIVTFVSVYYENGSTEVSEPNYLLSVDSFPSNFLTLVEKNS